MTSPDLIQVLERIGHGPLQITEDSEGVTVVWSRHYPCGELSQPRQEERPTRDEALAAVVIWEDEEDVRERRDDPRDRCLICFPEDGDA